jgi:hypothetical protein
MRARYQFTRILVEVLRLKQLAQEVTPKVCNLSGCAVYDTKMLRTSTKRRWCWGREGRGLGTKTTVGLEVPNTEKRLGSSFSPT